MCACEINDERGEDNKEAMHNLNISTTRALSLVVSEGGDVVRRPWYKPEADGGATGKFVDIVRLTLGF